jgi:hypothetical protein
MTNHRNAGNMRFRTRKGGSKRWSARRRTVLLAVAPSPASSDIRSGILPFYGAFKERLNKGLAHGEME